MKNMRKGFTITEVMIAAAISTIIIFGAFTILRVSSDQLTVIHTKMNLEENSREALFKMAQEIRQTSNNKITNNFGAANANGVQQTSTLSFIVPVPAPNAASLVDVNFDPKWANSIQYSLDQNEHQILRTSTELVTNATAQGVLANGITSLVFSRKAATPEFITITVNAQQTLSDGRQIPETPMEMTMQAQARNP